MSGQFRTIFVTVGTTEFKELFESIDKSSFVDAIAQLGCRRLNIQVGRGDFPVRIPVECQLRGIDYDCFQFKPNLNTDMIGADLIISHCGAGSILEAVNMRKPLIVVVNTTLQGNHQTELADAMADDGHCLSTTPEDLVKIVNQVADGSIPIEKFTKMFPEPDLGLFPKMLSEMFGFDD